MAGCGRNTSSSGRLLFSYFLTKWMMEGFKNCIYSLVPRLFSQLASTREKIGKENEKKKKKKKKIGFILHSSGLKIATVWKTPKTLGI